MAFAVLGSTFGEERLCHYLRDDGADFSHCRAEAVTCTSVAGGKTFSGDDESCGVGAKVEEELCHDVEHEEGASRQFIVSEADDSKYWG